MTDDPFRPPRGGDDLPAGDEHRLPDHEIDEDATAGAGVMGTGGTAIDRGTGELTGTAQGDGDEESTGVNEGMIAGVPTGGAQAYTPAFVDDDEDGGSVPDA